MNKQITQKAASIAKRVAKAYGANPMVAINEDPMNNKNVALYLDGDIVDLYWNNDGFGWSFQERLREAWEDAGIFVEPYSSTIFSVYKNR